MSSSFKNIGMGVAVLLVLFLATISSTETEVQETSLSDLEMVSQMKELLHDLQLIFDIRSENVSDDAQANCRCGGGECSCCQRIRARKLKFDKTCCLTVRYLRSNYGILIVFTYGRRTLFRKKISLRNPPPVCAGLPFLKRGAAICVQFYNLNVARRSLSGCSRGWINLFWVKVAKFNLGCFQMRFLDNENAIGQSSTNQKETNDDDNVMELPYYDIRDPIDSDDIGPDYPGDKLFTDQEEEKMEEVDSSDG